MVKISLPPPTVTPDPVFLTLPTGTRLVRLFNPSRPWKPGPLTFTYYGPNSRFDHHRPPGGTQSAGNDPDRGIYYAAATLSCCIVEIFGDDRDVDDPSYHVAFLQTTRPLRILDLCDKGAMRAGSVSALCSTAPYDGTQAWSRYFYEDAAYQACEGLQYHSAHNNEPALALYERAADALACPPGSTFPLNSSALRSSLLRVALDNNMRLLI